MRFLDIPEGDDGNMCIKIFLVLHTINLHSIMLQITSLKNGRCVEFILTFQKGLHRMPTKSLETWKLTKGLTSREHNK